MKFFPELTVEDLKTLRNEFSKTLEKLLTTTDEGNKIANDLKKLQEFDIKKYTVD